MRRKPPALSKPDRGDRHPRSSTPKLPKAIADYAEKVNDLRASIKSRPRRSRAAKTKVAKATPPKRPSPPKRRKNRRCRARPKAAKAKKAPKPKAPAQAKPASAASAKKANAARKVTTPRSSLSGKDKCLEDLRAYLTTGKGPQSRRVHRLGAQETPTRPPPLRELWTGWHEFLEQGKTPSSGRRAPTRRLPRSSRSAESPSSQSSRTAAAAPEPTMKTSKTTIDPAGKWPLST